MRHLLLFLLCLSTPAVAESNLLSTTVAEVGEQKIYRAELEERFHQTFGLEEYSFDEQQRHKLLSTTLNQLVKEKLLQLAALQDGIQEDSSDAVRQAFIEKLRSSTTNSHEELSKQYIEQVFQADSSKERLVRHIMLKEINDENIQKLIRVRLDILRGEISFIEAARKYSEAPSAVRSGELGWITENQLDRVFSETAFKLEVGELSQVVQSKERLHLILVDSIRQNEEGTKNTEFSTRELKEKAVRSALKEKLELAREKHKVIIYFK